MSLGAVANGQHYNIVGGAPPAPTVALQGYDYYSARSIVGLLTGMVQWALMQRLS